MFSSRYRKSFRPNSSEVTKYEPFEYYVKEHECSFIMVLEKQLLQFFETMTIGVRDFDIINERFGM